LKVPVEPGIPVSVNVTKAPGVNPVPVTQKAGPPPAEVWMFAVMPKVGGGWHRPLTQVPDGQQTSVLPDPHLGTPVGHPAPEPKQAAWVKSTQLSFGPAQGV
jgi:hypothetical protein